ncbi:MAG TPA: SH3 domain-containing protein [Hyphomicrobiaceae bacterium]|nr:SH3 domain-containing protein [Hyphomicrobiaceae bacterium]
MIKPVVAGIVLCAASAIAWAQARELTGAQITALVAGAAVEIDTPTGSKVPVRYTADGRMTGEAGELAWYLGAATDRGRWWVANDQLCHKWNRWFNSDPQCMRLTRDGDRIRWLSADGNSGTASIIAPAVTQASAMLPLPRIFSRRLVAESPVAPTEANPSLPPAAKPDEKAAAPAAADTAAAAPASEPAATEASSWVAMAEPARAPATAPPPAVPFEATATAPSARPAPPRRAAQPLFMVANVRADDVLNVRSGPSADFDIVGALPPGSRGITITDACRARWCPVQHLSATGWVNSAFLAPEPASPPAMGRGASAGGPIRTSASPVLRDSPEAPRACLTRAAHALLDRIEQKFGPVQVISTCRPGSVIAGTNHPSRHASGNAIDFNAGSRKAEIVAWLVANHHGGGTMTYTGMEHIHVDIGPHFVSIAGGRHWASWNDRRREFSARHDRRSDDDN